MIQKFRVRRENKRKKAYLSVGSVSDAAGTPKNRVRWHTRGKILNYHVVAVHTARGSAIIPVGTTVSVHGLRPSPFPSLNSIFPYIVADPCRFVKEMGVLFTIRLLIVDYKSLLATTKKRAPIRWEARVQSPSGHTKRCSR